MDTSWYHVECFKSRINSARRLEDLDHYCTLRWADQQKLRSMFGQKPAQDAALEARTDRLWEVKDIIGACCKPKDVKMLLEHNSISFGKASMPWLTHRLADALVYGRIGLCPECGCDALAHDTLKYVCYGNLSEFSRCKFEGEHPNIRRYKFLLPKKGVPKELANFAFGDDYPKEKFVPLTVKRDDDSSQPSEEEPEEKKPKKKGKQQTKRAAEDASGADAGAGGPGKELAGMRIAIQGTAADLGFSAKELKEMIESHGGTVATKVDESVRALVTCEKETSKAKPSAKVADARKNKVGMVTIDWLLTLCGEQQTAAPAAPEEGGRKTKKAKESAAEKRNKKKATQQKEEAKDGDQVLVLEEGAKELDVAKVAAEVASSSSSSSGAQPKKRLEREGSVIKIREKPIPGSDILKLPENYTGKGGEILVTYDPEWGYTTYNAVLNMTDVMDGSNKFYRMSIVKESAKRFIFCISYGRIGTTTGGDRTYTHNSQDSAIAAFVEKFEKFADFRWDKRHRYQKQPKAYLWVNLDDGVEAAKEAMEGKKPQKIQKSSGAGAGAGAGAAVKSGPTLDERVRSFLRLIFDEEMMTSTLMRLNVDVKKMPLGKISKAQMLRGYSVLSSISDLLTECSAAGTEPSIAKLADFSNQFYTLIPHDFGAMMPPIINSLEAVKEKLQLVEALVEIGDAVEIISHEDHVVDPLQQHYVGLRSKITPVDKKSERFKLLERYMHEGHDKSYFGFGIKVVDILEIRRDDEGPAHVAPYKDLGNRQLLWHGSRLSNWAGILSKGLRIAPPEAPKTGYRLGKGIYLADTVSKSGSYCFTDSKNPVGVMMLAEAALGNQWTTKKDKYMEAPQPGFDSTLASGQFAPDPSQTVEIESCYDGLGPVQVPCGAPKEVKQNQSSAFSHDELVVYDTRQVTMRYLYVVEFDHKKGGRW